MEAKELFELLDQAAAVIVDHDAVVYPSMISDPSHADEDDVICLFSWDAEGLQYDVYLSNNCNPEVDTSNNIVVQDTTGASVILQILEVKTLSGESSDSASSHENKGLFTESELDVVFEISRIALADAQVFDDLADAMDVSDLEMKVIQEKLNQHLKSVTT